MKVVFELNIEAGSPIGTRCKEIGAFITDFGQSLSQFDADIHEVTHRDRLIAELRDSNADKVYARARIDFEPFDTKPNHDPDQSTVTTPCGAPHAKR